MLDTRKQIIKGRSVVDDDWSVLKLDEGQAPDTVAVPDGKVIVPVPVWLAQRDALAARAGQHGRIGIWFAPDELATAVQDDLGQFAVIAIDFPKFTDGRGYSIAFNLRRRLHYKGELRAIGDVLRDQLFQMQRCGFDAYATRPDRNIHDAVKGLSVFSETYQASVDQPQPLFRRQARGTEAEHTGSGA
ncbi:DUF934 domain-containing protein [Massilia forsythiae]|uniref:DUF934 domain-containing protein n=1 Tax=Massilia forsythiae TaxID=2728020 RepID=A0A7Z2VTM8_9BURK|nr:DUF934 domain-containing protein [Massilia forsythiae]QJD98729.1 DUF934 domain-containing protein [Massilia forsythiae]